MTLEKSYKTLASYLGVWGYEIPKTNKVKLYRIIPYSTGTDKYALSWGTCLSKEIWTTGIASLKAELAVEPTEALRRIRDKQKAGWGLIRPWAGAIPESASIDILDIAPPKPVGRFKKAKKESKEFSLDRWLQGKDYDR